MKTDYQYIKFRARSDEGLEGWLCRNRVGSILGGVEFYRPWKKFVFWAADQAIFDAKCLVDISRFLETTG